LWRCQGKGHKDRFVPIGFRALAWVERYLVEVRPMLVVPPDEGFVFLTLEGNDLTPDHLTGRIGRYIRAATGKPGSCHAFRHAMATLMLEHGADIRHIQEMLKHDRPTTTVQYLSTAHADPEKSSLAASGRAVQRLVMDKGNLR
jgi:integrase/recombinase XerD